MFFVFCFFVSHHVLKLFTCHTCDNRSRKVLRTMWKLFVKCSRDNSIYRHLLFSTGPVLRYCSSIEKFTWFTLSGKALLADNRDSCVRFGTHLTRVRFNVITLIRFTCVRFSIVYNSSCAVSAQRIRHLLMTRSTRISCAIFSTTSYHDVEFQRLVKAFCEK